MEIWLFHSINNFRTNNYKIIINNSNINKAEGYLHVIYIKKGLNSSSNIMEITFTNFVTVIFDINSHNIEITDCYKSPSCKVNKFMYNIFELITN